MSAATIPAVGRRERAKQDKRARIFAAAAALFAEHGFERVTTQQIADRADVGAGTLFQYASTKGELFLMVYNGRPETDLATRLAVAYATIGDRSGRSGVSKPYDQVILPGENDSAHIIRILTVLKLSW